MDANNTAWNKLAADFESAVDDACDRFKSLSAEVIEMRPQPGSWSIKEILGHLIDSASNNHQRFVRLQIADNLVFPDYSRDNSTWIAVQNYQETACNELLSMCTPFDEKSVDVIVDMGFDILKVASCSATDWPLLEKVTDTGLPVVCSTGGLTLDQVDDLVSFFNHRGVEFALMYCVSVYPIVIPANRSRMMSIMLRFICSGGVG